MVDDDLREILIEKVLLDLPLTMSLQSLRQWTDNQFIREFDFIAKPSKLAELIVNTAFSRPTPEVLHNVWNNLSYRESQDLAVLARLVQDLENGAVEWRPSVAETVLSWAFEHDPLTTLDGFPFVDRTEFRRLLPRPQGETTPACLVVLGEEKTGKSHLSDYCEAYAKSRGSRNVGIAKQTGQPHRENVRTIALRLAKGLGTNFSVRPPPEHAEPERDAKNLADWIARYTPDGDIPAIALIDGYGRPDLPYAVHVFIGTLASFIASDPTVQERLRLILTGYDVSRLLEYGVDADRYVLGEIEGSHLDSWFRTSFPDQPDYRYDSAVSQIMQSVDASQPHARLENLKLEAYAVSLEFDP